jgi:hypothetical protein
VAGYTRCRLNETKMVNYCGCCQVEYDDWIAHVLSKQHINWVSEGIKMLWCDVCKKEVEPEHFYTVEHRQIQ